MIASCFTFTTLVFIATLWSPIVVLSESMAPVIRPGDVVFVNWEIDHGEIIAGSEGDIIVIDGPGVFIDNGVPAYFYAHLPPSTPIVHRAIEKVLIDGRWYFVTKGDNNPLPDGCIRHAGPVNDTYALIEFNRSNPVLVPEEHVVGIVILIVPHVGLLKLHGPLIIACCVSLIVGMAFVKIQERWKPSASCKAIAIPVSPGKP